VTRPSFIPTAPSGETLVWATSYPGKLRCRVYRWSIGRSNYGRFEGRGWVRCGFVDLPANTTWHEYCRDVNSCDVADLMDVYYLFAFKDQVEGLLELFSVDSTMRPS